jgi:capsular exopolysaccharide synthesis family protein
MEKIKAALAKVKSKSNTQARNSESRKTTVGKPYRASRDIGSIDYTNTKVIQLNAMHLENNRIISHLNHNANASIFDSLRTQILQKMEDNNWQTIAVVSPTPASGKTLVSINLAMSIARQPQKTVVLADFDLRKPKVASYLGADLDKSLNDYLENKIQLEDALFNPGIQRMVVLPTMHSVPDASETLASSKVSDLIVELKARYESRVIIFDLPPILNVDDAMVLLPQVDCVLMVIANGVSTEAEIEDALHLLPKENVVGIVYNMADSESKAYYY